MDIIVVLIIVVLGLGLISLFRKKLSADASNNLKKAWFFHLLVGTGSYFFTRNGAGDAWWYWSISKKMSFNDFLINIQTTKGTYFMHALNYFPSKVLDLGFFANSMLFALIGFLGFIYFYVIAYQLIPFNSKFKGYKLFPLLFFMPNLHFWSSSIGKDTILFMCIGMFCYGLLSVFKKLPLIILALLLSYLIRPHIAFFLLISFGLAYLFGGNVSKVKRLFFSLILIGVGIVILPTVMEFAKIEETSLKGFQDFSENKVSLLSRKHTGSRLDTSSYPFLLKIFSFLFRPFFFDVRGILGIIASFENVILLILTYKVIFRNNLIKTFKNAPFVIKGMFIFLLIGTFAFSQFLGNIGIMIRMRNMFLPGMIIFILWSLSYQKSNNFK